MPCVRDGRLKGEESRRGFPRIGGDELSESEGGFPLGSAGRCQGGSPGKQSGCSLRSSVLLVFLLCARIHSLTALIARTSTPSRAACGSLKACFDGLEASQPPSDPFQLVACTPSAAHATSSPAANSNYCFSLFSASSLLRHLSLHPSHPPRPPAACSPSSALLRHSTPPPTPQSTPLLPSSA